MTISLNSIAFANPTLAAASSSSPSMTLSRVLPTSLGFHRLSTPTMHRPPLAFNLRLKYTRNRPVLLFAASHDESKASDIDIDKEKKAQESQEAWQQTLASFKEQALKMQSISKEAYEQYSKKAIIILNETSEKLKIQAEKARQDVSEIAKEIAEESKEYLATAAENSPEAMKDIVETFADSSDELSDMSKVRDFYVGIPYGAFLSAGGFLSFMLTGSIPAIRFGVILGGTLLALGISSLRSWKRGEPSPLALKGQAVIASVLFIREMRMLSMRTFIANFISTTISGGVVAFYLYRIVTDKGRSGGVHFEGEPGN
ncbi:protein FATTY ACID EXPORT 3, chloroplastic [Andrographis paniculata]|uniref:protein FATTY ACID EXPORT 3, chloroplastic n=1 Tax=Andrographis paniculata TaxID=175694 RepID=UPI0021E8ECA6|nr:protein FATTY ACID EXPORT 3, chloroplastic [Andrographis paniculata]